MNQDLFDYLKKNVVDIDIYQEDGFIWFANKQTSELLFNILEKQLTLEWFIPALQRNMKPEFQKFDEMLLDATMRYNKKGVE
jgi:hypothetical protein